MAWEQLKAEIAQVIKTNGNQEITGFVLQQELFRIIDAIGGAEYDPEELSETIRKTINPSSYVSYLPESTPFTTAAIAANTPTKTLIPTTVKLIKDFGLYDKNGGVGDPDYAVQYQGDSTRTFKIFMSTAMATSVNNVVFDIYMYRNGIMEPGVGISRKIGTGADVGAIATLGEFTAEPNDYLEVFIKLSLAGTVTFYRTSIIFTEKN